MDTLTYVEGTDLRIRFDTESARWKLEQVRVNRANGATNPHDLAKILDLDQEGWSLTYEDGSLNEVCLVAIAEVMQSYSRIRSIDLGPFTSTSPTVVSALDLLNTLIL